MPLCAVLYVKICEETPLPPCRPDSCAYFAYVNMRDEDLWKHLSYFGSISVEFHYIHVHLIQGRNALKRNCTYSLDRVHRQQVFGERG